MSNQPADSASAAMAILRDSNQFQWYVIPIFVLVLYVYSVEIERKNWNVFFAGLAFWGFDWFNEIMNGLVMHFTGFAPLWGAPADTAYLIFIGLNIEICFMFAILGICAAKTLPDDPKMKIAGIPNRWLCGIVGAILAVVIELFLNAAGALTWEYWWWNLKMPWLIIVFGYLTFFMTAYWVHDMEKVSSKIKVVTAIFAFDAACIVLFAGILHWI